MKKIYVTPWLDVVSFSLKDIILTSLPVEETIPVQIETISDEDEFDLDEGGLIP